MAPGKMKIVVIGGTGLIGSKLIKQLREHGEEAVPAAPDTGVNTLTGEGLADALQDASVVVDVSKNFSTAASSKDGEFDTSTTTSASFKAAARPSPVSVLTPESGDAGTA